MEGNNNYIFPKTFNIFSLKIISVTNIFMRKNSGLLMANDF